VPPWRLSLTTLAVAGSQILTGALNDWADRDRDLVAQRSKPIASGVVKPGWRSRSPASARASRWSPRSRSVPFPLLLGAVASGSAAAYNLWLSRTPYSVVPYLISFSILPLWIAAALGRPRAGRRRAAARRTLRRGRTPRERTARLRRGRAARVAEPGPGLGRTTAFRLAWALALAVGLGVGRRCSSGPGRARGGRTGPRRPCGGGAGSCRPTAPVGRNAHRGRVLDRRLGARHSLTQRRTNRRVRRRFRR
jgi:hypothetical protein